MSKKNKGVLIGSRDIDPTNNNKTYKCEFASFIDENAKKVFLKRRDIANWIGIDAERFRKIVNRNNPTKKRDCIIACGFALGLSSGATNDALLYYDFPQLDSLLKREEYISILLDEQEYKHRSLNDINICLREMGYSELDIIDHRNRKEKKSYNILQNPTRYINRGIRIECRLDEQVFTDQYNSLVTEYSPDRYCIVAKMRLTDLLTGKDFELIAEPNGYYSRIDYPTTSRECIHSYKSLEETQDLCSFFEIIQNYARQELVKKANLIRDSRNYRDRVSACVIDNSIHIFTETYDYEMPEFQEYFLMDYIDGEYQFTASDKSRFMELYLSPQEYHKYYGRPSSRILFFYSSEEEIKEAIDIEQDVTKSVLLKQHLHAYRRMKKQIMICVKRLINKEIFIVHPDLIVNNDIDIFEHYCKSEESCDELDRCDLYKGFILGLQTLDEIKAFKEKYESLEISNVLQYRD